MSDLTKVTINHNEIRKWVEARGGVLADDLQSSEAGWKKTDAEGGSGFDLPYDR